MCDCDKHKISFTQYRALYSFSSFQFYVRFIVHCLWFLLVTVALCSAFVNCCELQQDRVRAFEVLLGIVIIIIISKHRAIKLLRALLLLSFLWGFLDLEFTCHASRLDMQSHPIQG